jgi:hypothetical protein
VSSAVEATVLSLTSLKVLSQSVKLGPQSHSVMAPRRFATARL